MGSEGGGSHSVEGPSLNRSLQFVPAAWALLVIVIPYLMYGSLVSFGTTFRSGGASIFICVAIVAALAESAFGLAVDALKKVRTAIDIKKVGFYFLAASAMFAWNLYFAVSAQDARHPTYGNLQILAFVLGAAYATSARWVLDPETSQFLANP